MFHVPLYTILLVGKSTNLTCCICISNSASFPSSSEDTNISESQPCWQPFICSSLLYSLSGLFFRFIANTSPSLVTPGHLAQARQNVLSSTMNTYLDHKDTTAFASVNSTLVTQPSLLPFPIHEQQVSSFLLFT